MRTNKLLIVALLSIVFVGQLAAQDETEPQYLFDLKTVKFSGFGGIITEGSKIYDNVAISSGGGGAVLLNYNFFLGFYGLNLTTDIAMDSIYVPNPPNPANLNTNLQLSFQNSGLWLGYINNYKKLFHWGVNMKVGQGRIALYDRNAKYDKADFLFENKVFIASPEIEAEVNVTRWFKINMGVGYRFVVGVGNETYVNGSGEYKRLYKGDQFNSPYANVKFLFGKFAKRNKRIADTSK